MVLASHNQGEVLEKVFGTPSLDRSLSVCLRLRRMKRRECEVEGERCFPKKRLSGRNYHHLTPRFRRKAPFYGDSWRNLLLIRTERHTAWHKIFGLLTLEEVIAVLIRRKRVPAWLVVEIDYDYAAVGSHACGGRRSLRRSRHFHPRI